MLYLFGRLALSDSYYFNDDFQADDYPENQVRDQRRSALDVDACPVATGEGANEREPRENSTKKPTAEFQRRAF
jgi:hypothetical protein